MSVFIGAEPAKSEFVVAEYVLDSVEDEMKNHVVAITAITAEWWCVLCLNQFIEDSLSRLVFSGHCKKLKPEFQKAAEAMNGMVLFAYCPSEKTTDATLGRFGVKGFPTIWVWKNGVHEPYRGERTTEALIAFARTLI